MYISVLEYLEETVLCVPDKTAVIDDSRRMTYQELMNEAQIIGTALMDIVGVHEQKPVILFMEKSCSCLSSMLGTLYSGNAYVPMDMKTPIDRLSSIINTLESSYIITTEKEHKKLEKICGGEKLGTVLIFEELLEEYNSKVEVQKLHQTLEDTVDTNLMYVLFTSGSTGTPKGVAISNRSVIDYIEEFVTAVGVEEEDVLGNQTPFYTDMSLKDIYMAIKVGATLCIIPQKYFMTPKKVLQYLDENGVTALAWVPTAYRIISQFDSLEMVKPQKLRRFLFSGEAMPVSVFHYWKKHYPNAKYIQQYGPTEITGACTTFNVENDYSEYDTIPIGKAFRNTKLFLLDEDDKEVKPEQVGVQGEICVGGTCLALGYYNNWEKTEELFVQNPLNKHYPEKIYRTGDLAKWNELGELIFISRKDYQVKHNGKRIELGEIETAVQAIDGVDACCCVHNKDKDVLVLYYVSKTLDTKEIILGVQDRLPKYMIPTVINRMEQLPQLSNGKIDRKKLFTEANEQE